MKAYVCDDSGDVKVKVSSIDSMTSNLSREFIAPANRVIWDNLENTVAYIFSPNVYKHLVLPVLKSKRFEVELEIL